MKHPNILYRNFLTGLIVVAFCWSSCEVESLSDPNNPSIGGISQNASLGEIQNVVSGAEASMRNDMSFYFDDVGMIGRDYYRFQGSDPRVTADLLGKGSAIGDHN